MKPTAQASGLVRHSTGVSPASLEMVKLLAELAIEQFLKEETESPEQPTEVAPS